MRRALLAIGGTAAGLAALLSFKTHPLGTVASAAPAAPAASPAPAAAGTGQGLGAASATVKPGGSPKPGGTAKPGGSAKPTGTAKAGGGTAPAGGGAGQASSVRTITGSAVNTQYGPMQVAVTLAGKRITKVTVLQQTNVGSESSQIDAMAIPRLTTEALSAQSAQIDAVSGATYTSAGYKQSLQSALDKAGA